MIQSDVPVYDDESIAPIAGPVVDVEIKKHGRPTT